MSAKGTSPKKTAKAPGAKSAGPRKPSRASTPKGQKRSKARKGKNTHWRFTSVSPAITAFLAGSLLTLFVVVFLSQEFFEQRMQSGAPRVETAQSSQGSKGSKAVKAQQKNTKTSRQGNGPVAEKAPAAQPVTGKKRGGAEKPTTPVAQSEKAAEATAPFPSFRLPRIEEPPSSGSVASGSSSAPSAPVISSSPATAAKGGTSSSAAPVVVSRAGGLAETDGAASNAASLALGASTGAAAVDPATGKGIQRNEPAASVAVGVNDALHAGILPSEAPQALSFKTQSEVQAALHDLQALPYEEDLTPDVGRQPLGEGKERAVARRQPGQQPMLVVVMDDLGMGITPVKRLIDLNVPVTFAFWPHGSHTQEGASMAHRAGEEILVHFPMEPVRYPKVKPGPNALLRTMTAQDVATAVQEGLGKVPHAVGLNNHMGSRFTQNKPGVHAVLDVLQRNGLFMLDSLTHPRSVFYAEAVRRGMQAYCRNVFLDVRHDKKSILARLRQTEAEAKRYGVAIAIGHPLPETLAALEEWQHTRDVGVKVVRLQDLP